MRLRMQLTSPLQHSLISRPAHLQHGGERRHRHLEGRGAGRELHGAGSVVSRLTLVPDVRHRDLDELPLRGVRPYRLHVRAVGQLAHGVALDPALLDVDGVAGDIERRGALDVVRGRADVEGRDAATLWTG